MAKGKKTGGPLPLEEGLPGQSMGKPLAFRIPQSLARRLDRLIETEGVTSSQVLREALVQYIDQRDGGVAA